MYNQLTCSQIAFLYMYWISLFFLQGVIRTALPNMDREVKEQYQVLIQAKDMGGQLGGLAGTTTVNITLTDVNDNPPRFPKSMFHSMLNINFQMSVVYDINVNKPLKRIRVGGQAAGGLTHDEII